MGTLMSQLMCKITLLLFIDGSSMIQKTGMPPALSTLMNIIVAPRTQRILLGKQEETDVCGVGLWMNSESTTIAYTSAAIGKAQENVN